MQTINVRDEMTLLRRLRLQWAAYVVSSLAFLTAVYLALRQGWGNDYANRWLLLALALGLYQFVFLWRNLAGNRSEPGAALRAGLGLANWITLLRGILVAALAGFLLGPWPQGWLAWAPSVFYLAAALMDLVDGAVARLTRQETILGDILDMKWDGAGMFLAATLAVLYGQAPIPFLLVGLARYLFLLGTWQRERRGLPVYGLLSSRIRRPFAGMMMGFVAVILMPVYAPPPTQVAATLFMIPFLIHFVRDWLAVSGYFRPAAERETMEPVSQPRRWQEILPLAVRVILMILLFDLLLYLVRLPGRPPFGMVVVILLGMLSISLGAAGRTFSLAVLLMTGFGLQAAPFQWRYWSILLFSVILMMIGTGRFSLWKPEDWLLYKRIGEPPSITGV